MKKILFLHGFASSGHNGTAIMLREQLYADGVTVIAPDIPVMPAEAMPFLRRLVADEAPRSDRHRFDGRTLRRTVARHSPAY